MKRKRLTKLLAVLTTLCVCTGFAACNKADKSGKDGITPTISIDADGYWVINGETTGIKAKGEDGTNGINGKDGATPTILINANGYWVINGETTDIKAKGEDGTNGINGKDGVTPTITINNDGYWVINGAVTEVKAKGEDLTACAHDWSTWSTQVTANCVSIGYDTRTCSLCDETEYLFHDATGHTYSAAQTVTFPTCKNDGTAVRYCNTCNLPEVQILNAYGHSYEAQGFCNICGKRKPTDGLKYQLNSSGTAYHCAGIESTEETVIVIPEYYNGLPVTEIKRGAFQDTAITALFLPDTIVKINTNAFYGCNQMSLCTLSESLQYIGSDAFTECRALTNITIPKNVAYISDTAFSSCYSLISISVDNSNPYYSSDDQGILYNKTKTKISFIPHNVKTLNIADAVTTISEPALYNCRSVTSVHISENNNSFILDEQGVLYNATKTEVVLVEKDAKSVTLPTTVKTIFPYAFHSCNNLSDVILPDALTSIGHDAFAYCGLTQIDLPDNITRLESGTFYCSKLTSIVIPDSVNSLEAFVFSGCYHLKSIVIPVSITEIGWYSLNGEIENIYYKGTADQWNNMTLDYNTNACLSTATVYIYSEDEPTLNAEQTAYDGNYWKYDENDEIFIWKKEN